MAYNSTIISKKKNLLCGHYDFNFSKGRCKQCATIETTLIRLNEANEKEEGLGELVKEADSVFSRYIRQKYADKNGMVKCFTCTTIKPIPEMQCGHYIGRANMFLRYDERNSRPQCEYCNCHKHGNLLVFANNLEQEYNGITEILYEEAKTIYKYSREELKQLILNLKRKIRQ